MYFFFRGAILFVPDYNNRSERDKESDATFHNLPVEKESFAAKNEERFRLPRKLQNVFVCSEHCIASSETQGQSVGGGRNGATNFARLGLTAPGSPRMIVPKTALKYHNSRLFYSCVLSDLVLYWKRG